MATMRAVDIKGGPGPATSLFINPNTPRPTPKPTESLIKVKAFGLNRADTLQRSGNYPGLPAHVSKILGLEFSGIVEEFDVEGTWEKGDEVFGLVYGGAYAEHVAVDARMLVRKPEELGWEECAAVPEVWMTALQALRLVGEWTPKVKSILWHAGASSVSLAGIQLSRNLSPTPKVFATARQDDKRDFIFKEVGATAAVNTTKSYGPEGQVFWADEMRRLNGDEGIDLIIDFIGAPYFASNLSLLAMDGRVVLLGAMGGLTLPEKTDISAFLTKRASFVGSTLRSRDLEYQAKLRDLFCEEVLPKLISGEYKAVLERTMSWRDVGEAHKILEENRTRGKIVCLVD